jgi:hypothetical protein
MFDFCNTLPLMLPFDPLMVQRSSDLSPYWRHYWQYAR